MTLRAYRGAGVRILVDVLRGDDHETRVSLAGEVGETIAATAITSQRQVAEAWLKLAEAGRLVWSVEQVGAFLLDARHKVVGFIHVSRGTLNQSSIQPRDVFRPAIAANSAAVIVVHNHPSGDVRPSEADELVTERLRRCGELLGIELLDHVILTEAGTGYSLANQATFAF